jgi:hypothetical protein
VAGNDFEIEALAVERALALIDPEPIQEHFVVIGGRRFPPKQVLAVITGLDRADFTTHQARAILRRLGFGTHRRSSGSGPAPAAPTVAGPHQGVEAALLARYLGRWVAQDGLEVLYDAESPESILRWLRQQGRPARVWRVPANTVEAGSYMSTP